MQFPSRPFIARIDSIFAFDLIVTFILSNTTPTKAYFDKFPPFSNDIAVAQLPRIHLPKLLANEKAESDVLFDASRKLGFFLLDFEGCEEGETFLKNAETMFDIGKEINETDTEEMMKYAYHPPHSLFGKY